MTSATDDQTTPTTEAILVIDIGGTNVKFGYSCGGRPLDFRKIYSTEALRAGDPVRALALMIEDVSADTGIVAQSLVAAVPGFIDSDGDSVLHAANVPSLNGRRLGTELEQWFGCPAFLERDAVLMLMGEWRAGVVQGGDDVLGVFFGTGVGAAFIHHGAPFRGGGWALEIGLMPFHAEGATPDGMRPRCLEAFASGRALRAIADRHGVAIDSIFLASRYKPSLEDELTRFVQYQAIAVGTASAMMSPATIVLGGGVVDMPGYPRDTLAGLIESQLSLAETGRALDLRWSRYGWTAALYGAPAVVGEHRLRRGDQPAAIARHPGSIAS